MNFIISTDKNLIAYLPTLINSIITNNQDVTIYVLYTNDVTDNDIDDLNDVYNMLYFIEINPDIDIGKVGCPVKSLAMFNRIYAIDILFSMIDKGLYLDIDTIVNCNCNELYNKETGECGLAGVDDLYHPTLSKQLNTSFYSTKTFDVNQHIKAFNSGVLLMDFKKLVKNYAQDTMTDILNVSYMTDQPLLNKYSNGRYKSLDNCYNVSVNHTDKYDVIPELMILHWHGKKPWNGDRPYQDIYNKYKDIE